MHDLVGNIVIAAFIYMVNGIEGALDLDQSMMSEQENRTPGRTMRREAFDA